MARSDKPDPDQPASKGDEIETGSDMSTKPLVPKGENDNAVVETEASDNPVVEGEIIEDTSDVDTSDTIADETLPDAQTDEPFPEKEPDKGSENEAKASTSTSPPADKSSGGGFGAGLFGGLIAAALACGALFLAFPGIFQASDTTELEAAIEAQRTQIDELSAQLNETTDGLTAAQASITDAQSAADQAQADIAALAERFEALPVAEVGELPADVQERIAAQREELEALQSEMAAMSDLAQDQIANAQAQREAAAEAAARAAARGALNDVRDAIANGGGFADALPVIAEATDIPDALQSVAENGVATVQGLQNQFPDAARDALLAANRADADDSTGSRFQLLLKESFGARSLAPREGDDPDAVLSRAEAALRSGNTAEALETIAQLPDPAKEALADWTARAQARVDASQALGSLTDALGAE